MRKISKLFLAILASATLLVLPSYAGEMAVSGSAAASYVTNGSDEAAGKNLGISNELDFTASGDLDNGMTWTYQIQLDGDNTANDDTKLVLGTDMGTVGFYVTEGGLSVETATGAGALGVGFDYISPSTFQTGYDVDGYSNIQYHLPADILPLGGTLKLGYVPNMSATTQLSKNGSDSSFTTGNLGSKLQMAQITAAPIDGLTVKMSAAQTEDQTGASGNNGTEEGVSANYGANYTMGQLSVGYTEGHYQPAVASGELTYYENKFMGIQFDVNDALSVSYNVDESDKVVRSAVALGASAGTTAKTSMELKSIQLAYTTGGATIGIAQAEATNADYTAGKDEAMSSVTLAIAF